MVKLIPLEKIIEFSNDGVSDYLTGSPAPKIFFNNLAREIAKSKRKFQPISIITVRLSLPLVHPKNSKKIRKEELLNRNRDFEIELIDICKCLKAHMRSGDFYSRLAENGFWICIQGGMAEAEKASERFALQTSKASETRLKIRSIFYAVSEWDARMNQKEWIHEIDGVFFAP